MGLSIGLSLLQPLLIALVLLLSSAPIGSAQTEPLRVAATVGMIGDVVAEVAGSCAEVSSIMGSGVDPHVYQASARDVRVFQDADVIFYAGYSLEGQLGDVLENFSRRKPTVALSPAAIPAELLITTQDVYGVDPHVWMDVSLWARIVPVIAETLVGLRPECNEEIARNRDRYSQQLHALHEWVVEAVGSIPTEHSVLVTAHDAFAYYGRAYEIEVAGIQGISTESEAGVADIREMARTVAERRVPAVFVESTINPRTIQAVVDATAQLGHEVRVGSELYSDAMGASGSVGGTYLGMIYENTVNMVRELGGEPPELPAELAEWSRRWNLETGNE